MAKGRLFVRQCASSVSSAWNTPDSRSETQNRHAASTRRGNEERSHEAPLFGITFYSPIKTGPRHSIGSRSESFKRLTSHILTCSLPSPISARQHKRSKKKMQLLSMLILQRQIAGRLPADQLSISTHRHLYAHAGFTPEYRITWAFLVKCSSSFKWLDGKRGNFQPT